MTAAEEYRAELATCHERVRVYVMGLESAAKNLERLQHYDLKLQEAIISAHVSGLPANVDFQDPINSLDLLATECRLLRASEAHLARIAGEYERLYNEILGPMLTRCRTAQDTEHGGPTHDDTHTPAEWAEFIRKFAGRAEYDGQFTDSPESIGRYQANMIAVAGLAIAAVQSSQRKVRLNIEALK